MTDFKQQMERYGREAQETRYPHSEAELDREIRRAVWQTENGKQKTENGTERVELAAAPRRHRLWPSVAAAAIATAVVATMFFGGKGESANEVTSINAHGERFFFACNSGCSPEGLLDNFNALLQ